MRSPGSDDPSISLLYVDDEPALLEIGRAFLELNAGFRVDTQETAIDALRELDCRSYDVIVSDYQMPDMDGIAFLKALRERGDSTPFIIFTGKGREDVVIEAFDAGADFYLKKGGDPKSRFAELERKVRKAVDLHRAERATRESEEKYRTLIDRAGQMLFLHDLNGVILDVNRKAIESTGYSREELLSMNVEDIDPDAGKRNDKRLIWEGTPLLEERIFETRHRRKDGSIYPAEVHASRVNIAGEPCILALTTDITSRIENEAVLQESEEKFRDIFENLQDIYYRTDPHEIVIMLSPSAAGIFGYDTTDAIIGKPASDFWAHPEERKEILRRIAEEGGVQDYEITLKKADGSPLPVSVSCRQIYDRLGKTTGSEGIIRDITKRKQAEEKLRESEEKFRVLVEHSLEGIFITDFTGNILFINHSAVKIVDASDEEVMVGRRNVMEFVAPKSKEEVLRDFSRVAGGIDAYLVTYQLVTDAKRTIWVECIGKKIDFQGRPAMLVSMRDITERRRAEKEKERNEYRFSLLANQSRTFTWEIDTEGLFTSISPECEAITGYKPEEIIGRLHFYDLHPEEEREEFRLRTMETIARQQPFIEHENVAHKKNGEPIWISRNGIPIEDDSGSLVGYWGTDTDITERKLTENALQTANKKLQILSSITRHDILNKIMAIDGYIWLKRGKENDQQDMYLADIEKIVKSIERQIEFTREYESLGVQAPSWHSIATLIEMIDDGRLPIIRNLSDETVVFADPMIEKVFHNLMENTNRHAEGASRVEIRCEERDGQLVILWEDDGPGVPDDQKGRIFERGYGKNTGLGLFLSREILAITGITITETGEYGKGAKFELLVPEGGWQKSDGNS